MEPTHHPDPFQDALSQALQRALQVTSSVVTGVQVYLYLRRTQAQAVAEHDDRGRRVLAGQISAEREAARSGWAPALDPSWLRQADLRQTAQAWGTAMPYGDRAMTWYEPSAASAMRKCEDRLRELHPFAMARYDRLRDEGLGPADAMWQAAPLFRQHPHAHGADYTGRPVLSPGTGAGLAWTAAGPGPDLAELGAGQALEQRGRQILDGLQARARAQGRAPLGEDEQRTVLESLTNLPEGVIDQIVQPAAGTALRRAGRSDRPWQQDFPVPVQEVVASAARQNQPTVQPAADRPVPARQPGRRPDPRP